MCAFVTLFVYTLALRQCLPVAFVYWSTIRSDNVCYYVVQQKVAFAALNLCIPFHNTVKWNFYTHKIALNVVL